MLIKTELSDKQKIMKLSLAERAAQEMFVHEGDKYFCFFLGNLLYFSLAHTQQSSAPVHV
jgi:hypothetical protein